MIASSSVVIKHKLWKAIPKIKTLFSADPYQKGRLREVNFFTERWWGWHYLKSDEVAPSPCLTFIYSDEVASCEILVLARKGADKRRGSYRAFIYFYFRFCFGYPYTRSRPDFGVTGGVIMPILSAVMILVFFGKVIHFCISQNRIRWRVQIAYSFPFLRGQAFVVYRL